MDMHNTLSVAYMSTFSNFWLMLFCFLMQKDRFKLLIWSQVPFICSMQCHFMNSRHLKRMDFFFFFFAAPNLKYVMHHC